MADERASREAWEILLEISLAVSARLPEIAAKVGLSLPQCRALLRLDPKHPVAMGRLACELGCDASNVTGIVDRLEAQQLLQRRFAPFDRRVRVLLLTERGREIRAQLLRMLRTLPPEMECLSEVEHELLAPLLRRLCLRFRERDATPGRSGHG